MLSSWLREPKRVPCRQVGVLEMRVRQRAILPRLLAHPLRAEIGGRARSDGCRHLALPSLLRRGPPRRGTEVMSAAYSQRSRPCGGASCAVSAGLDLQFLDLHDAEGPQAHRDRHLRRPAARLCLCGTLSPGVVLRVSGVLFKNLKKH